MLQAAWTSTGVKPADLAATGGRTVRGGSGLARQGCQRMRRCSCAMQLAGLGTMLWAATVTPAEGQSIRSSRAAGTGAPCASPPTTAPLWPCPAPTLQVVEIGGQRVVLADDAGTVRAVSNKCSHLGLPLVGKVPLQRSGWRLGRLAGRWALGASAVVSWRTAVPLAAP